MNRSNEIYYQNGSNNTNNVPDSLAYSSLLIASIFWGGNYLPVKHYGYISNFFYNKLYNYFINSYYLII